MIHRKPLLATLFADDATEAVAVSKDDYGGTITIKGLVYDGSVRSKGKPVDLILSQKEAASLAVAVLSQIPLAQLSHNRELLKRLREYVDLASTSQDEEG